MLTEVDRRRPGPVLGLALSRSVKSFVADLGRSCEKRDLLDCRDPGGLEGVADGRDALGAGRDQPSC